MRTITITAPAKVNTILRVIGRREDGYHDLQMVMVPLTLADELEISEIRSGIEFGIDLALDSGMVGDNNLVCRAARLLQEAAGIKAGARINLKKRVPIAAGLGGGSSDAAATLKGLNSLWNLNWSAERLAVLGAKLGADVPFFCFGRPAYVEGIGDRVTPYDRFPNLSFLLINPSFAVPTSWVYKQWDLQRAPSVAEGRAPSVAEGRAPSVVEGRAPSVAEGRAPSVVEGRAPNEIEGLTMNGSFAKTRPLFRVAGEVVSSLHNDLEAVTIPAYPEITGIKKFLAGAGAVGALMSGSGPTVFGVFEDSISRDRAFEKKVKANWRVFKAESKSNSETRISKFETNSNDQNSKLETF